MRVEAPVQLAGFLGQLGAENGGEIDLRKLETAAQELAREVRERLERVRGQIPHTLLKVLAGERQVWEQMVRGESGQGWGPVAVQLVKIALVLAGLGFSYKGYKEVKEVVENAPLPPAVPTRSICGDNSIVVYCSGEGPYCLPVGATPGAWCELTDEEGNPLPTWPSGGPMVTPTRVSSPPPLPTPTSVRKKRCITISSTAPPNNLSDGIAPNTYRAWLDLGKPSDVTVTARNGTTLCARNCLSFNPVHNGDMVCSR